jgi:uncharacterized protein with PQ loop repeat
MDSRNWTARWLPHHGGLRASTDQNLAFANAVTLVLALAILVLKIKFDGWR